MVAGGARKSLDTTESGGYLPTGDGRTDDRPAVAEGDRRQVSELVSNEGTEKGKDMHSEEELASLSDEEQIALLEQTDNRLDPDDEGIEQPSQDPDFAVEE